MDGWMDGWIDAEPQGRLPHHATQLPTAQTAEGSSVHAALARHGWCETRARFCSNLGCTLNRQLKPVITWNSTLPCVRGPPCISYCSWSSLPTETNLTRTSCVLTTMRVNPACTGPRCSPRRVPNYQYQQLWPGQQTPPSSRPSSIDPTVTNRPPSNTRRSSTDGCGGTSFPARWAGTISWVGVRVRVRIGVGVGVRLRRTSRPARI